MDKKSTPSFVQETIKKKPVNKSRILKRTFWTIVMAVVFGVIACTTFLLMEPVIEGILNPERIPKVSFPEEEVPVEQLLTEESKAQKQQQDQQAVIEEAKEAARLQAEKASQNKEEISPIETYSRIYTDLSSLASESHKYMVTVISSQQMEDWLMGSYESRKSCSGIVVADNTYSLFILADLQGQQSDRYLIVFSDGSMAEEQILQMDNQTGLAVFEVSKNQLSDATKAAISPATLGSSSDSNLIGKPVIAVGSPQGVSDSIAYGIVTSNSTQLQLVDANYGIVLTDIAGYEGSSGCLVNLKGEVIGVILQNAQNVATAGLAAVGISELKSLIAKLSNNEERVYLGVRGIGVTQQVHDQMSVPYGAYVTEVEAGSPAMQAGIRIGDIIVQIGNNTISSFRELRTALLTYSPQEEQTITLLRQNGNEYQQQETQVILSGIE